MFERIRWHLVGWTMLVVALILAALGTAVYGAMSRSLLDQVDRNLASRAAEAIGNPRALFGGPGDLDRERYRAGLFYLVVDRDGRVLINPQRVDVDGLDLGAVVAHPRVAVTAESGGEPVRLYGQPVAPERGGPGRKPGPPGKFGAPGPPPELEGAVLVVGQSLTSEQHARPALLLILTIGGVGGLVLALAGAWFLAGRALVPIQQAFRRQQEFVADASHELRTPLTVLRLATDLLHQHRREPLAANGELFDDVRSEIGRLQRLTADLLTLARSDRGELELAVAAVDLAHLTTDVVRRVGALAQARGVELAYAGPGQDGVTPATTPEQSDAIVDADPDRLQQVLLILLDNAVQYTPSGGRIAVAVGAHDGYATVEVVDDGPGIAPEHLARVFERFYRADAARTRGEGGTGLGLAIAKSLVEAHRGELSLTSQPGAGTRALVTLPRAAGRQSLAARIGTLARRYAR